MRSRILLNLLLVAVVAGLALLVFLEPGLEQPEQTPKLTTLDPGQIQRVRIERSNKETVVIERSGGDWQLVEPLATRADKFRLKSLLRITGADIYASYPLEKIDPAELGLESPKVRLFLDGAELRFGTTEPINGRRYVQLGNRVHLISDFAYYQLVGGYATFVSQRLLPEGASIQRLELPGLSLRRTDGGWTVDPEPEAFSADQANRLADAWRFATAMEVQSADDAEGKGEPLRITTADGPIELRILSREPELVLVRPDLGVKYRFPAERGGELFELSKRPADTPKPSSIE